MGARRSSLRTNAYPTSLGGLFHTHLRVTLVARGPYECARTGDGSKSLLASKACRPHGSILE